MTKTFTRIEYEIGELEKEREALRKELIEEKIIEYANIIREYPNDVIRLLRMFATDVKYIYNSR